MLIVSSHIKTKVKASRHEINSHGMFEHEDIVPTFKETKMQQDLEQ